MKAYFCRKRGDIEELRDATFSAKVNKYEPSPYEVIREVYLDHRAFRNFADDFFDIQPWIQDRDGGMNKQGEVRCIRVINTETGEKVLVNPEGYDYPRYTAIEE